MNMEESCVDSYSRAHESFHILFAFGVRPRYAIEFGKHLYGSFVRADPDLHVSMY